MLNASFYIILNNFAIVNPFLTNYLNFFVKYLLTKSKQICYNGENTIRSDLMAIGERIKRIRTMRGMTLKYLGESVGFPANNADVRMAQYEKGTRTPKADLTKQIADVLGVVPETLDVPNIESYLGVMHTLFALEDTFGLKIDKLDGEVCIRLDKENKDFLAMAEMFKAWEDKAEQLRSGEITKEEYDNWRYNYPNSDTPGAFKKISSFD